MPLSDHERKVLADMEAALTKEDPKLVSALNGLPKGGKGFSLGLLALVAGMAVLVGGLVAKSVPIGALGFLVALAGLVIAISALPKPGQAQAGGAKAPKGPKWSDRLSQRWDERER
jgi:hypothetical protein